MYSIRHYQQQALVKLTLVGEISEEQLHVLTRDLEQAVLSDSKEVYSLLADLTRVEPLSSMVTGQLAEVELRLLTLSPVCIAQLVSSELVAHQLDRVVEAQQTNGRLRHFWDAGPALSWLDRARPRPHTT